MVKKIERKQKRNRTGLVGAILAVAVVVVEPVQWDGRRAVEAGEGSVDRVQGHLYNPFIKFYYSALPVTDNLDKVELWLGIMG